VACWYDRVDGKSVKELPDSISSGRYQTLEAGVLNEHTTLEVGDLLLNDGSNEFNVLGQTGSFSFDSELALDSTESDIIESVILEYKAANDAGQRCSFLIPEKLLVRFKLLKFEELIYDVVRKGHLQEIARRPRLELVYKEYLLPVSRAKKIPNSASIHLASHSQCWQTRTLTGVIPKEVLALESEDKLNIYENRVYVKLLDLIERYLRKRISEVQKLEALFNEANRFQDAQDIYFELRECIFKLWGEGFTNSEEAEEASTNSESTLQSLIFMLKQIRSMQNTKLYRLLKSNLHVPPKLKMTNVLSHDQHYRHVARLWNGWLETLQDNGVTPEYIYNRNKEVVVSYELYCLNIIKRTLKELGFAELDTNKFDRKGSAQIEIKSNRNAEIILSLGNKTLCFIPLLYDDALGATVRKDPDSRRIVLSSCNESEELTDIICCSPTNFYSLEKIAKEISEWLTQEMYKPLGMELKKQPKSLVNELATINDGHWHFQNSGMLIFKPFLSLAPRINRFMIANTADVTIQKSGGELLNAGKSYDNLLHCPSCGVKADESQWLVRDNGCFAINQSNCQHEWKVNQKSNGAKVLEVKPSKLVNEQVLDSFKTHGRYFIELEVS
jgi:hypothetical protein